MLEAASFFDNLGDRVQNLLPTLFHWNNLKLLVPLCFLHFLLQVGRTNF